MPELPLENYCLGVEGVPVTENPYPQDKTIAVNPNTSTSFLSTIGIAPFAMPTSIDPGNPTFGVLAASLPVWDESFDGILTAEACMPLAGCGVLDDPCPFDVPGLLYFEAQHLIFRTAALFKTGWDEVDACFGLGAGGEATPTGDGAWWFNEEDNSHHLLTVM